MSHKKGSLPRERYMTVLGGYTLDMHNHGHLVRPSPITRIPGKDYGAELVGPPDAQGRYHSFRMVPSGDIVDLAERNRRLETV